MKLWLMLLKKVKNYGLDLLHNNFMEAYNISYKPVRFKDGVVSNIISTLQYAEKLMMRLSYGFLFRNLMDTWIQLYSQAHQEIGMYGILSNAKEILKYTGLVDSYTNCIRMYLKSVHLCY